MTKIKLEVAIAELKKKYQYQSSVDALLIGILIDHIEANSINTYSKLNKDDKTRRIKTN